MGVMDSVRGVLWARRRRPDEVPYIAALAHERFSPRELVDQAIEAERCGFDGIACSDHLQPWWPAEDGGPPAHSGNAWVWLGAAGQATDQIALGTAVTALVHRYNPVVVAQQVATLESLFPGRAYLGVGSGEALNEVPAGMDWPPVAEQIERTEEALQIITRLLDGETVDFRGRYFQTHGARLFTRPERRPPVYMSAFGPEAAQVAGRHADGVWTLADPRKVPQVIAGYRAGVEEAGREPGEIILQTMASWAPTDDAALEGAREWKGTLVPEHYTDDVHDPALIRANGAEVPDAMFKAGAILSADSETHVRRIKAIQQLGATAIAVMIISGADPRGTLRRYGEEVLPELRG
jgi:coenzyme F420-dependent glucose-6-phosphate dehydrogenase